MLNKKILQLLAIISNGELGENIGFGVCIFLMLLGFGCMMALSEWDGQLPHNEKDCVKIINLKNKLVEFNSCNGNIKPVKIN